MTGTTEGVRVAVTLAFLVTGVFCVWRCVAPVGSARSSDRVGYAAHALMSASMIATVWSPPVLVGWQMALFAVAAAWFVLQAIGVTGGSLRASGDVAVACAHLDRGARVRCLHHALLMVVMVWMFRATAGGSMVMSGSLTSEFARAGAIYSTLAAALLAMAVLAARPPRSGTSARDDAVHAVVTAGMATMLLAMA
jgi:hypothetical protein